MMTPKVDCGTPRTAPDISQARIELAAAFRWFARLGMHESVANHFSMAVSDDGRRFLMNPRGIHFSRVRASDILLLDAEDKAALARPDAPDPTAWFIHARIHRLRPQARCIMHLHPKYATALAALEDNRVLPIDQNTMRFYGRVATDNDFGGMALSDDEGDRLAQLIGDKNVLLMANHGVLVAAPAIALAFDELYYFERACETLITCYATGKKLRVVDGNVAHATASQWSEYTQLSFDHLREVMRILDVEEPEYRS